MCVSSRCVFLVRLVFSCFQVRQGANERHHKRCIVSDNLDPDWPLITGHLKFRVKHGPLTISLGQKTNSCVHHSGDLNWDAVALIRLNPVGRVTRLFYKTFGLPFILTILHLQFFYWPDPQTPNCRARLVHTNWLIIFITILICWINTLRLDFWLDLRLAFGWSLANLSTSDYLIESMA